MLIAFFCQNICIFFFLVKETIQGITQFKKQMQQQQQQQCTNASSKPTDQISGDLLPIIEQLLTHFPANGATMPIDLLLSHLQNAAPNVFTALDRFIVTARMVCKVDEEMALQ